VSNDQFDDGVQATPLRPRPVVTRDTAFFWDGVREHRLLIQRCSTCASLRHPPTAACAVCGDLDWKAVESRGKGVIFSYTVVHAPVVEPFRPPYVVALIALDEGIRLISEVPDTSIMDISIGARVVLDWLECDPELTLPVFRLATATPAGL